MVTKWPNPVYHNQCNKPSSVPVDKFYTLVTMYRAHSQRILDSVNKFNFTEVSTNFFEYEITVYLHFVTPRFPFWWLTFGGRFHLTSVPTWVKILLSAWLAFATQFCTGKFWTTYLFSSTRVKDSFSFQDNIACRTSVARSGASRLGAENYPKIHRRSGVFYAHFTWTPTSKPHIRQAQT